MGLCAPFNGMGRKRSQEEIDAFYKALEPYCNKGTVGTSGQEGVEGDSGNGLTVDTKSATYDPTQRMEDFVFPVALDFEAKKKAELIRVFRKFAQRRQEKEKPQLPKVNTEVFTSDVVCDTLLVPGRSLNGFDEDLGRLGSE